MNVLKPHLQTTITTLLASNTSHRQIERVTGIDRKTIRTYAKRIEEFKSNSPGVATGTPAQIPPPRPPAQLKLTTSICEPHRAFIEAQLRFKRNYMAIYQDLVDSHGFGGAYNSVKRFCGGLCKHEPEQCVAAGANMQRFGRSGNADGFWASNAVFAASSGVNSGALQISTWPWAR